MARGAEGMRLVADSIIGAGECWQLDFSRQRLESFEARIALSAEDRKRDAGWRTVLSDGSRNGLVVDLRRVKREYGDDYSDQPLLEMAVRRIENGDTTEIFRGDVTADAALYSGNSLKFCYNPQSIGDGGGELLVMLGDDSYTLYAAEIVDWVPAEVRIEGNSGVLLESVNVQYGKEAERWWSGAAEDLACRVAEGIVDSRFAGGDLDSGFVEDNLDSRLAAASGLEGRYRYLDSEFETKMAIPGGKYELALLSAGNGNYELVYIDGADNNVSRWRCGMVKGVLKSTRFENHFNLEWIDSRFDDSVDEAWAEFTAGPVMILHFPREKAVMRFYRED